MAGITVGVEGLRPLIRDLEKAGAEVDDLKDVFAGIAAEGAQTAQRFTPSRSGALRATVRGNRAKNKAVVTFGKARVPYAGPIIYGWPKRNIKPSRTIIRTDEILADLAPAMLDQGLDDILTKLGLNDKE